MRSNKISLIGWEFGMVVPLHRRDCYLHCRRESRDDKNAGHVARTGNAERPERDFFHSNIIISRYRDEWVEGSWVGDVFRWERAGMRSPGVVFMTMLTTTTLFTGYVPA
ncbi:hypothetical protein GWI33_005882 [Rhynchophorus ferrugineus]|uniref:Uncharacterized protein n=1 Tax=Rhynchophorus ferrugineus TaxID=354439 RepID=A0A834IIE8_RHYFE|nr:hypothetical protein GWI33_005882 [Rhynchophorus ferrugineus]